MTGSRLPKQNHNVNCSKGQRLRCSRLSGHKLFIFDKLYVILFAQQIEGRQVPKGLTPAPIQEQAQLPFVQKIKTRVLDEIDFLHSRIPFVF